MPSQPYHDYWWIWCLWLVIGFGACIGSFINVVIYRLPRSIPFRNPARSFCPNCLATIAWRDNIPVLSYFRLHGQCRHCQKPISPRYVVVEVITVLVFLILFDAFFVGNVLQGITGPPWSTAYRFYSDWPIYAAHVILFSCLLSMSVIDMELYWVDIRFTHFAAFCGFVLHAIWTPARQPPWPRPGDTLQAAALISMIGVAVTYWLGRWYWKRRLAQDHPVQDHPEQNSPTDPIEPDQTESVEEQSAGFPLIAWIAGLVLLFSLALLIMTLLRGPTDQSLTAGLDHPRRFYVAFTARNALAAAFIFLALLAGAVVPRRSDQQIEQILEAERHTARREALREFLFLLPPLLLFILGVYWASRTATGADVWSALKNWEWINRAQPFVGLGTAAAGFFIAAALGWTVRIVFTWILGKEAYGAGDIHILAAAGAVTGWETAVIAFFLSCLLALAGWVLTLPFKRSRAMPMGPWLTLAIFLTALFRDPATARFIEPFRFLVRALSNGR